MTDSVCWSLDDAVATITLNRPQARNALTAEMKGAPLAAVGKAAADEAVRAVIITGAGEAFCSGQDVREHADVLAAGAEPTATVRQHYNPIITTIMTMPKPVVAAVNGSAAGGGRVAGARLRLPGRGPPGEPAHGLRPGGAWGRLGRLGDPAAAGRRGQGNRAADACRAGGRRTRARRRAVHNGGS